MLKLKKENKLSIYKNTIQVNTDLSFRTQVLDNTNYTIVPVVMMTVGVHAGSQGPVFYSTQELSHFHQAWNGVPVSLEHPQLNGQFVSCNQPGFYETQVVGKIFNTTFEDGKLKAEAWLETNKSGMILTYLRSGRQLEVSTGLMSDDVGSPGQHLGISYNAMAANIRPDHLALLPGGTGACSWQDGCGVRANKEEKEVIKKKKGSKDELVFNYLEDPDFIVNEMDYLRLMDNMRTKIDSLDVQGEKYCYLRAMTESYVVYKAEYTGTESVDKLYKRNYSVVNEEIEWTSDPQEVTENTTYPPVVSSNGKEELKLNKGEKTVTKKKEEVCCLEEVKAFVANNDNGYTEKDVGWMSTLPEDQFKAVVTAHGKEPEVKPAIEPKVEPVQAQTYDELLANASPTVRAGIEYAQKVFEDRKTAIIESIKANKSNKFTEEDLKGYDMGVLEKLNDSFGTPITNYSGRGGELLPKVNTTNEQKPMRDVYAEAPAKK